MKTFTPSPAQVQTFLTSMITRGVIGGETSLSLRTPSNRTRQGRNPFTKEIVIIPLSDSSPITSADQVAATIAAHPKYSAIASGMGRPKTPPVPVDFDNPYHVGIHCVVSPSLCSMSDVHEESESDLKLPWFGRPCDIPLDSVYFTNPNTLEVIERPLGGCAHFWIELALGNGHFPPIHNNDLDILNPVIVDQAAEVFEVDFIQGCYWG